ncbi:MAG: CapA family protein, partial [Tannerella sp.]|nr:CapA family protein [Tannerella sp.]
MRIFQKIACIGLFVLIVAVCYVLQDYKGTPPDREKADHPALPRPGGRARLVFAGDLMQHLPQVTAARTGEGLYDYSESFRYVKDIFQKADLAIINLETTLNPSPFYTGYPMFRSPSSLAGAIKDFGVDVAVMANNHVCDNGMTGIEHTIHCLDSLDIAFTGAFADSLQSLNYHPRRLN